MPPIVVLKFGGRLVETPERIQAAAQYIIQTKLRGADPIVVVSAPGRTTDEFRARAREVASHPDSRELDMLLSVGERMAIALLAMAVIDQGPYRAVSFTGSQVGIITDTRHTDARILEVKGFRLREALESGCIPIVAGFQGISTDREITTLGRGGSDATAVALAVALKAERCELIKECGGVFSADPLIVEEAQLHPVLDYATLLSITEAGAKVVQPRAAALAQQHKTSLFVKDINSPQGTLVSDLTLTPSGVAGMTLSEKLALVKISSEEELSALHSAKILCWMKGSGWALTERTSGASLEQVDMITIVGWGGNIKPEVVNDIKSDLQSECRPNIGMFMAMGKLGLFVPAGSGAGLMREIHRQLKEKEILKTIQ